MAVANARQDVKIALDALGAEAGLPLAIHQIPSFTSSTRVHPVESAIRRADESLAISMYPDAVNYTVRLNVSAYFEMPPE